MEPEGYAWVTGLKRRVFERDDWCCQWCGTQDNLTLDHVIPRSKGGRHTMANLQTLCRPCNGDKGDRMPESFRSSVVLPLAWRGQALRAEKSAAALAPVPFTAHPSTMRSRP